MVRQFLICTGCVIGATVQFSSAFFAASMNQKNSVLSRNFHSNRSYYHTSGAHRLNTLLHSTQQSYSTPLPPAITIENLSCSHGSGDTYQLDGVSYVLPRGAKVALVGRNGSGKSTLLRILAERTCSDYTGESIADAGFRFTGQVTSPRSVRVAFVEQEPFFSPEISVGDALLGMRSIGEEEANDRNSVYAIARLYRRAVQQAASDPDRFAAASAAMDSLNGWQVLTKAEEIATRLRVRHLQESRLSELSGGERKRVALAAALVQEPDVLLLDEPTNFLSLAGVQWLADLLLAEKKLTILMVTHDRAFLDEVCDSILELDNGQLYQYTGKYADYLQGKQERLALQDAALQAAKAKYKIELDWIRRQPQARETKQKARIDAFFKLEKATKPRPRDPSLNLLESSATGQERLGSKILSMRNVNLKYGDRVMLKDFSYDFCKGDRICLAGANGIGKTTFLRVLTSEIPADSGTIEMGETVVLGVYDQLGIIADESLEKDTTVLSFVTDRVRSREGNSLAEAPDEARRLLRDFEFPRQRWNEKVSVLSGGERRRLQMLSVFSMRPNFLVLDEPSVDCDLDTLQALESYLQAFEGVLLVVSHDRAFADKVTDHLFVFEGDGEIKDFQGTLSEYASTLVELENDNIVGSSSSKPNVNTDEKKANCKDDKAKRNEERNMVRRAKKDMDNLDRSLEKLRTKAADLQKQIDGSANEGWTVLAELTEQLNAVNEEIDEKELKWMEIAELLEAAEVEV